MTEKGERRSENHVVTIQNGIDTSDESSPIGGARLSAVSETNSSVRGAVLDGEMALAYDYRFHAHFYARLLLSDVK